MQVDNPYDGVWSNAGTFEVYTKGSSIEFDVSADGGCRIGMAEWGNSEVFHMTPAQFAAFKEWVAKTTP